MPIKKIKKNIKTTPSKTVKKKKPAPKVSKKLAPKKKVVSSPVKKIKEEAKQEEKRPAERVDKAEEIKKPKQTEINVRLVSPQTFEKTEKEIVEEEIKKEEPISEIDNIGLSKNNYIEPVNHFDTNHGNHVEDIFGHEQVVNARPEDERLIEEILNKGKAQNIVEDNAPIVKHKSFGLYRKIAYGFIFFTAVLLAAIFYLSFVKVSITIIPKQENVSDNLTVDIYDSSIDIAETSNSINGVVATNEVEETKKYPSTGIEVIGEEAVGKVFIINDYNKNQSLVATTRLLTPDNKLFRIKNTVNVPAGGSVEVEIYADDPGPAMAIGPTKFKIPGLWAGLQEKIYAESKDPVEYKQKTKKHITQSDIDNGVADLKKSLLAKAQSDISGSYQEYDQVLYDIRNDSMDIKVDSKVGDEKEEFSIIAKASVAVIAFKDDKVFAIAKDKLNYRISDDKELPGFNRDNMVYSLNNYDVAKKTASVSATFQGLMSYKSNSDIIDKAMLPGLDKAQLMEFLDSKSEIEDYEIKFYPSFINKVPSLVDRIEINIKKSKVSGGEN